MVGRSARGHELRGAHVEEEPRLHGGGRTHARAGGRREQSRAFEALAAWADGERILTGAGEPEALLTRLTTGNFFAVLGAKALIGRTYTEAEELENVAVLSHSFWKRRFGGDPGIVDRTITLNDRLVTVLGVMPPDLPSIREKPNLWAPTRLDPEWRGRYLRAVGRLNPGASLEQARTEMATIGRRLAEAYPEFNKDWGISVSSLQDAVSGEVRPALLVLLGAVGFLLLIACANVANLLLNRAVSRRKEVTVRRALGATRGRLIRQSFTESLVLAVLAGALGLVIATAATRLLVLRLPVELALPSLDEIGVDLRVVAFTGGVSLLTGMIFGLAPALSGSSVGPGETMRDAARGTTGGRDRSRIRGALVVTEVALALVLLVGTGLLARSFQKLMSVDTGLRTEQVLTMRIAARSARYRAAATVVDFADELQERLAAHPGTRSVGIISPWLPLTGQKTGDPLPARRPGTSARGRGAHHGYPRRRGRLLPRHGDSASEWPHLRFPRHRVLTQRLHHQR